MPDPVLGRLFGSERDGVPELLQALDMVTLDAGRIKCLKVISSQISIRFLLSQDMVEDDQDLVGESHDGFLLAATAGDAVVKGREIGVFRVRNGPGDLCEHASQIGIALGGLPAQALAAALFVARTDLDPLLGGRRREI